MTTHKFTSESVSEGHPDKLADQISDAIVDEALRLAGEHATEVRCACETLVKGDLLVIAGEMRTVGAELEYEKIALQVAHDIGYVDPEFGFNPQACQLVNRITEQSADIARGVDRGNVTGAGDQGLMFGYACDESPALMPLPLMLAHRMMIRQAELKRNGHDWLRPDAKSQVSVRYVDGRPTEVTDVVLSTQHAETINGEHYSKCLHEYVIEEIIKPELGEIDYSNCRYHINPTGKFIRGGPQADAGLTGRKIIVDTYGGSAPHGGGAFSGKDPSKVDRSAAYAARHIAKNVVASGLARKCLIQVSYAIGEAEPVSLMCHTYGTGKISEDELAKRVRELFDMSPQSIISRLDLCRPIYRPIAAHGHFGREDIDLPWEDTTQAQELLA